MESKDIKILAIVGMSGSGKSTAIDYLTERKIPKVYFGGIIYKAMDEAGIERTPENDQIFRKEIREREGNDFVVKRAIKEVQNLIAAGQKRIALDGLYSWTEYKILRKEFPTEMTVIAIVMPKRLRSVTFMRLRISRRVAQSQLLIIMSITLKTSTPSIKNSVRYWTRLVFGINGLRFANSRP